MSSSSPLLQHFIDDELARAPLLIDEVLQGLADAPLRFDPEATSVQRRQVVDKHEALHRGRPLMVKAFAETLREQVATVAREQAAAARGITLAEADALSLSLVDEHEVATDVELQRAIVVIHSTAEYELRELGSFTSALVGDVHVAHATNPFRPDAYAHALLAAARALPAPAAEQLALMRQAAAPLAQSLRKAYAAACTRLESQGVEPGTHRTIIMPPGTPGPRTQVHVARADLNALRDSMPVPLDMPPPAPAPRAAATGAAAPAAPMRPAAPGPSARVDQQLIELLTRLFDAILADPALPPDVQALLSRMQTSAVRVALRDPGMLDSYEHPSWEFMDRLVYEAERLASEPDPRERFMRHAHTLVDNLVREPVQDAALYRWGLDRFTSYADHLLMQRCQQAQAQIDSLRSLALSDTGVSPPPAGAPQALDIGSLETVPAELMNVGGDDGSSAAARPVGLPPLDPGDWLNLFLQGSWRELQLLWRDVRGELWLFRQGGGRTWALRRAALERLHCSGLAEPMTLPSLVQQAAQQVLRQVPAASRR